MTRTVCPYIIVIALALQASSRAAAFERGSEGCAQQLDSHLGQADDTTPQRIDLQIACENPPQVQVDAHRHWSTLRKVAVGTLIGGELIDSWGTYKNVTHTRWVCGNSPAFNGSYDTNATGELTSLPEVGAVCGIGPAGQSANWAFDVSRLGYFSEGGWVSQWHLSGERNFAGIEGWNLANDVGWYLVARQLEKRKGWIGRSGTALNFARGIVHLQLGIGNFTAIRNHRNPNTLDLHIPKDSHYNSPRWWGVR